MIIADHSDGVPPLWKRNDRPSYLIIVRCLQRTTINRVPFCKVQTRPNIYSDHPHFIKLDFVHILTVRYNRVVAYFIPSSGLMRLMANSVDYIRSVRISQIRGNPPLRAVLTKALVEARSLRASLRKITRLSYD